jgi:hypothetical protein
LASAAADRQTDGGSDTTAATRPDAYSDEIVHVFQSCRPLSERSDDIAQGGGESARPCREKATKLQAGNPSFGALVEDGNVGGWQFKPHHPLEEVGRLCRREPQVGLTNAHHLPARSQAG